MTPPRFRLRTLLITTTVVAVLLSAFTMLDPQVLVPLSLFGVFLAVLITPQWALQYRSQVPDELIPCTGLLLGALSFGPGSLATVLLGIVCLLGIDYDLRNLDPAGVIFCLLAAHVLAALLFLFAVLAQIRIRRSAGTPLNAICAAYAALLLSPFLLALSR